MAKKKLSGLPLLSPERAIAILENQVASAEKLRSESFGSVRRDEWTTTTESALARSFDQNDLVMTSFGAAQTIAFTSGDSEANLQAVINEQLDRMLAVLRSAIEQFKWQLPEPTEVFHPAGSQHDAYVGIREIVSTGNSGLTIVDPYVDETLWIMLKSVRKPLNIRILTQNMRGDFGHEAKLFSAQHHCHVEVRTTRDYHDRFVVVDRSIVWHLGASIKDAGGKAFAMTELKGQAIRTAVITDLENTWNGAITVPL